MLVNEIFYSIQGEGTESGYPTIFIRFTGCNLRCAYCDTAYAFFEGKETSIPLILKKIKKYPCSRICLTGGEPLLQKELPQLIKKLAEQKYSISIETNGSLPIKNIHKSAQIVLDIKTPCSRMENKNLLKNLKYLRKKDSLKIVAKEEKDLIFAKKIIQKYPVKCPIYLSPVWPANDKKNLADWLLRNPLPETKIQVQLHKVFNIK